MTFDIKTKKYDSNVEFVGLSPSTGWKRMTIFPSVLFDVTEEKNNMISQKLIKEWLPSAIDTFKSVMPPISKPYPEISIASPATLVKTREALVARTGTPNVNMKNPYTSMMETLHGPRGDAILIYQKHCPETKSEFNHSFWHELGHFYAVSSETENFSYLAGQTLDTDTVRQTGYWLWNEFIAESISNSVSSKVSGIDREKIIYPEIWSYPYGRLQLMIQWAYNTHPYSFDEYSLAFYYATLLTDECAAAFSDAAIANELLEWDCQKEKYVPIKPGSVDYTAMSMIPEQYSELLTKIGYLLERKTEERDFWKVDGDFLDELGTLVCELNEQKGLSILKERMKKISEL